MRNLLSLFLIVSMSFGAYSQSQDTILAMIGDMPLTLAEYKYIYAKTSRHDTDYMQPAHVKDHFDKFINFKLKTKEGIATGLDTTVKFKSDVELYMPSAYKHFLQSYPDHDPDQEKIKQHPDFKYDIQTVKDAMLYWDVNTSNVWDLAKTDTTGQRKYFEEHKFDYMQNGCVKADIYYCCSKSHTKAIRKHLKKGETLEQILLLKDKEGDPYATGHISKEFGRGENENLDPYFEKTGVYIHENDSTGQMFVIHVKEKCTAKVVTFREISGIVINDYMKYLDKQFTAALKEKHPIVVNEEVYNMIFE